MPSMDSNSASDDFFAEVVQQLAKYHGELQEADGIMANYHRIGHLQRLQKNVGDWLDDITMVALNSRSG